MNDRIPKLDKSLFRMTLGLWIAVLLLLVLFLVVFSESEAMYHHGQVSGWYGTVLNSVSSLVPLNVMVP